MGKRKPRPTPVLPDPLPGLVDAHTHLYSCGHRSADEVRAAADRAALAGVAAIVTVGDDLAESEAVVAAAEADERVYAAVAVHPTRAREATDPDTGPAVRDRLAELAAHPRVVAVGETGLDHYWVGKMDGCADPAEQEESLRWHAGLAADVGKCLMIHNREADDDLMRVLAEVAGPGSGVPSVMLHCFSSPLDVAKEALDRGYVLSSRPMTTCVRRPGSPPPGSCSWRPTPRTWPPSRSAAPATRWAWSATPPARSPRCAGRSRRSSWPRSRRPRGDSSG